MQHPSAHGARRPLPKTPRAANCAAARPVIVTGTVVGFCPEIQGNGVAQRVNTQLVSDLSGDEIAEGAGRTVEFSVSGMEYSFDLTDKEAAGQFGPFDGRLILDGHPVLHYTSRCDSK